jgi:RNA polymerase sigma factor (sigma-70 family)
MARSVAAANEQSVLRARARGELSADQAFERLYSLYAPLVLAWLRVRVSRAADADDLQQDVWMVLYDRWKRWEFRPEMESAEARPILSFLFRTAHFVLRGHSRRAAVRAERPLEAAGHAPAPEAHDSSLELGRCLDLARRICPEEEQEVLAAKLSGVPAREIARALAISEAAVDHRFRGAIARLKRRLEPAGAPPRGKAHA